jgi:hypothetical protein
MRRSIHFPLELWIQHALHCYSNEQAGNLRAAGGAYSIAWSLQTHLSL